MKLPTLVPDDFDASIAGSPSALKAKGLVKRRRPSSATSVVKAAQLDAKSEEGSELAVKRLKLDSARTEVRRAEQDLAKAEAALAKMQERHAEAVDQLATWRIELRTLEAEISKMARSSRVEAALTVQDLGIPLSFGKLSMWERCHSAAAAGFCSCLQQISAEGAHRFQDGMWSLWQAAEALHPPGGNEDIDPTTHSLHSCYHIVANLNPLSAKKCPLALQKSPYGEVSQRWLLSFEAMARQLKDEHARVFEEKGFQAMALKRLVAALGRGLDRPGTRNLRFRKVNGINRTSKMGIFGLSTATDYVAPELDHLGGSWAVLPLIWLPLSLYVRSTTHLYEMLNRLHSMQVMRSRSDLVDVPASGSDSSSEVRALLDQDERRYSYLVFAITAALQTLILSKEDLGRSFPFSLLASSPPDPAKSQCNGYPMKTGDCWTDSFVIFRGIWIGAEVDEERAMFQYSFNSFSRQIEGAAQVLSFYASVEGSPTTRLANSHKHVLILVARQRYSSAECFALPVQLLDGPRADKSEMEVLMPPFARYEFDNELSLTSSEFSSDGPSPSAQKKIDKLRSHWKGFELPPLLLQMLQRNGVAEDFPEIQTLRPFVSVRFVKEVTLAEPMRKLFSDSSARLYDFKR
jgi:hypothetical protein